MPDLDDLNRRFGISNQLAFIAGPGNLTVARIENSFASCDIALHGAHILTFQPRNESPLIWLSPQAKFALGKSVRGGVPVCWPWFGNHASETQFPAHGFARTSPWDVISTGTLPDGATQITFTLEQKDTTRTQWPHACELHLTVTVGRELAMELATQNTGAAAFEISEALHTYFSVGNIDDVLITGLEGCDYLDKVESFERKRQVGAIRITTEVDRIYLSTSADCVIHDAKLKRRIRIRKTGSQSTVVWNPWVEKCTQMGDMGEAGYRGMVCVESANAAQNAVTIEPGETHRLSVGYSLER